jgi:hypothetical protein
MSGQLTEEQRHSAEQIVRRWLWAVGLSAPADRSVEQGAVGSMAVALLKQLIGEQRTRVGAGVGVETAS